MKIINRSKYTRVIDLTKNNKEKTTQIILPSGQSVTILKKYIEEVIIE